ncbi:MAG: RlmE family RNA methyltransferase [Myxococcota bacterium]|nr:RlmE family RNA methyltransferase [Myxococcota bacterium]
MSRRRRKGGGSAYRGDHFTKKAKGQGYAARSVYKLEEIDRKVGLFKPGMRVVDLGCYPGSWTRYAAQKVGPKGVISGVDLDEPQGIVGNFIVRSVYEVEASELLEALGGPADVVLSDMAPKTTGHKDTDHLRQIGLVERAHFLAQQLLKPGGAIVYKIFDGSDANGCIDAIRQDFQVLRRYKPEAVRSVSREFFIAGTGFKGMGEE